jgi:hypothetical protein
LFAMASWWTSADRCPLPGSLPYDSGSRPLGPQNVSIYPAGYLRYRGCLRPQVCGGPGRKGDVVANRYQCLGPNCKEWLTAPGASGGQPRKFCSESCRSRSRRLRARVERAQRARDGRVDAMVTARHMVRTAAYRTARAARVLAAEIDAEDVAPDWRQPGWHLPEERLKAPHVRYTVAAAEILAEARDLLAAAVEADRIAGIGWPTIGQALGVSADTAARRYRPATSPAAAHPSPPG